MSDLFQYVNFLKHFPPRVLVFDICFVYAFDGHMFSSKLMNAKSDFTKGALAQEFYKLIEV